MSDLESALLHATTVGTMLDEPQLCFLYALATMAPDGPAVECGVYKGGSLSVWAEARLGRGNIYAVDTWEGAAWGSKLDEFRRHMRACDLHVQVLQCNSWVAPGLVLVEGPVAFCFVDADHTKDGVPHDIKAWPDAIMPGGILAFHDYLSPKPTCAVKQCVDAWHASAKWHQLGIVGSVIAFMRPRLVTGEYKIGGTK